MAEDVPVIQFFEGEGGVRNAAGRYATENELVQVSSRSHVRGVKMLTITVEELQRT
jgi:hypothetical protein